MRGQVWIETVLYTLIGLALIALVLIFVTPQINETKDRVLVEQSIDSLQLFDEKIQEVIDQGEGNRRSIPAYSMRRGELVIDGVQNEIRFDLMDLKTTYSEPDIAIPYGRVSLTSKKDSGKDSVSMVIEYPDDVDLKYNGQDEVKKFSASSVPYIFSIENKDGSVEIVEDSDR